MLYIECSDFLAVQLNSLKDYKIAVFKTASFRTGNTGYRIARRTGSQIRSQFVAIICINACGDNVRISF